ncbi:MAG: hypothetical protein MUE60_11440 [Candidatus Eisenbacteria bacterium]|jgi:hypothetical protein|nr:hypothetical protein [Candidatus Eisenbacteria bacterium]
MSRVLTLILAIVINGVLFRGNYGGPLSAPPSAPARESSDLAPLPPCVVWQPLSCDFGKVDLGAQATTTVVLKNTSSCAHEITEIETEAVQGNAGCFTLSGDQPPFVMDAGETKHYTLSYRPRGKGLDRILVHAYNTGYSPSNSSSSWDAVMSAEGEGVIPLLLPKR